MINRGYIKFFRSFIDWEWHNRPETATLFMHLLVMANYEEKTWRNIRVKVGQVLTSINKLSVLTGLSTQMVRTALKQLTTTGEITLESTNNYTIITISNYDKYQNSEERQQQTTNTQLTSDLTNKLTGQLTTMEEEKNINNYINNNTRAREDWRYPSSVIRSSLGFDADRIAEYKRDLFRQQVEEISSEIGMTSQQVEAFVRWWTEHTPGNDKLKAEYEITFDIRDRAKNWIERDRPRASQQDKPKSRMDAFEDDMKFIHDYFHGQQQTVTSPDEQ